MGPQRSRTLSVTLVVTLLFAAPLLMLLMMSTPSGSGTPANLLIITTVEQLQAMNTNLGAYYALGNDIDASATRTWNENVTQPGQYLGFEPIGTYNTPFTGSFDGRGYKISNLYINRLTTSSNFIGLFGYVENAVVKNVGLENENAIGRLGMSTYVGGLVGRNYNGTVDNSYSTGSVIGENHNSIGGLVGSNDGTVSNSYSTCSVSGQGRSGSVGGLVGGNGRTVSNSYHSTGSVIGATYVGGLVGGTGGTNGTVDNCYSTGSVSGDNYVGGLVGFNGYGIVTNSYHSTGFVNGKKEYVGGLVGQNYNGTVSNSYSTGSENGENYVGGLVGLSSGTVSNSYSTGSVSGDNHYVGGLVGTTTANGIVSKCYSTGSVIGHDNVGGLVGQNNGTVSNSYSTGSVSGTNDVGGLIGYIPSVTTVSKCYSTGSVSGTGTHVGGLVGYKISSGRVDNSFWDNQTSGRSTSAGGTGKTTENMKYIRTYTDNTWSAGLTTPWDFLYDPYEDEGTNDIWIIRPAVNDGYPFLTMTINLKIVIVSPADGTKTTDNTPTFEWDNNYGDNNYVFDKYEIWVDNDANFSSPEFLENVVALTRTLPPENSLADDNYHWMVRAYLGWIFVASDNWTFMVDTTPPLAPSLISPGNHSATEQATITFQWNSTSDDNSMTTDVSGVRRYELWVDNNSNFSSPEIMENLDNLDNRSKTETLAVGTYSYYWKVRAWDWVGNPGVWSSIWDFMIENFTLRTSFSQIQVLRGHSTSDNVFVKLTLGTSSPVSLEAEWVGGVTPSGITSSFSPESGTMTSDNEFASILTFSTSSGADTGAFTCRITATGAGNIKRTLDVAVSVTTMVFSVDVSPRTTTLMRLDNATLNVTVNFQMGVKENDSHSGSCVGSTPEGVSASFTSTLGLPDFSSVLSFATTDVATTGSFTYRVTGTSAGGATSTVNVTINVSTTITITVITDNASYEKGQWIRISGTAKNPKNEPVGSGTATISIVSGSLSKVITSAIANGAYSASYFIALDNPEGTWTIYVTAVDNYGNTTSAPVSVDVTVTYPVAYRYYVVTILSPTVGQTYFSRGQAVTVMVQITENNTKISGANVVLIVPSGDNVHLAEGSLGVYSVAYTLPLDTPTGEWDMSVIGEKTTDGVFKAGASLTMIVSIAPATLSLTLNSPPPTKREFEAGETVKIEVQARYIDGSPVNEGIIVVNKPRGENLTLTAEGGGIYGATYIIGDGEVGTWNIQISAVDAYGNSSSMAAAWTVIVPPGPFTYVIRYWPVVLAAVLGLVVASAFVAQGRLRTRRLGTIKREKQEIERLRKEAALEYFKKGAISRETYDNLTKEYATKLTNLDKEERLLMDKMKKKKLSEKKHPRKKGK